MRTRWHPRTCKVCGRTADEVGGISATGLCQEHSIERLTDNLIGLTTKSGEPWRKWRESMAACVGGVLMDERREAD